MTIGTFAQWKVRVDAWLVAHYCLTSDDLPDWRWCDAYDAGMPPSVAASKAWRAAQGCR